MFCSSHLLQVNIASLENVVKYYLNLAREKTEDARRESHQALVDIDDLDIVETSESILPKSVAVFCFN